VHGRSPRWQGQPADVFRMEAVYVLARVDAVDQRSGVDMRRQRQLHQDAMNARIGVELVDQLRQFGLRSGRRKVVIARAEADMLAGAALVAHIDGRRGIVADKHYGEARHGLSAPLARPDPRTQFIEQFIGNALAVEDSCVHALRPLGSRSCIIAVAPAWLKPQGIATMIGRVRQRG